MIKFAKTFAKFGVPSNIPLEDQFYFTQDTMVVADGITRDSIGCPNLNEVSREYILQNYPNPSPATKAAEVVCKTFQQNNDLQDLEKIMLLANANIAKLNENLVCDYLENDYAACVAASAHIENDILHYSYICDCGVIVWDKNGNIRFQTSDDKALVDPYLAKKPYPWYMPEGRVIVRRDFRNNLNNIIDGKCVSYGAFTGEKTAEAFVKTGYIKLEKGDTIAVFSDGFTPLFELPDFFENLDNLENYVKTLESQPGFGSEKTIIIMSLD